MNHFIDSSMSTHNKRTIFLIDDDDDDRMLLKGAIEEIMNVSVVEFLNGLDFVDWISGQIVEPGSALILLDMNMPKMNGIETIQALKSNPISDHLAVIIISTSASKELLDQAYQSGASGYLTKPDSSKGLAENAMVIRGFFEP